MSSENVSNKTRFFVKSGLIAAIYVILTYAVYPYSFGPIQFRISEAMCILPLFYPEAVPGLFVGCVIANILSPNIPVLDLVFGSAATLVSAFAISRLKGTLIKKAIIAPLINTVINSLVVAFIITLSTAADGGKSMLLIYAVNMLEIAAGEAVVGYVLGVPLMYILDKRVVRK